jgi:hypothetical protein
VHAKLVSGCIGKISFCRQNIIRICINHKTKFTSKLATLLDPATSLFLPMICNISFLAYDTLRALSF